MDPQRKRPEETVAERTARERQRKLIALRRLQENPDFAVLREFLQAQHDARIQALLRPVKTAEDQAEHNQLYGEMIGLRLALAAADTLAMAETERVEKKT